MTWPAWFVGADLLLAALAVLLAFLLASFVARNTDLWLHLAAGQRLLAGEYRPGTDPFSYSAADRAWVNHSLLYDVGAYFLFRVDPTGAVLVFVKALVVALTFGLLLSLRRAGNSLWPWAATATVAALAAAPRLALSPLVGSLLLMAVTLVLVFRMPHRRNSWRFPIAIGITFWLWAMVDSWFFVGPLTLALVLIGELAQRWMGGSAVPEEDAQPLGVPPDVPTLARALAVGIIACMLNPHHVRVWELPFELIGTEGVKIDSRLKQVLMSPLNAEYSKPNQLGHMMGYNLNGLAYVVLFVSGGLVLGLSAGRLRLSYLALWVGFALLSLASIYAIPFFAVVAVPIVAAQLNAFSSRIHLRSWGDPKTRFVLLGSASGRVITVAAAAIFCVLTWPGWAHPYSGDPAFARRVAWGIYRDNGMVRAAEQLETWRREGRLPPDAKGLITTTELANYCAWFAPSEKVFINGRYNHHRKEIPDYITFRKAFALLGGAEVPSLKELDEKLRELGVEYVAVSAGPGDGRGMRFATQGAAAIMWMDADRWSPWYLNGRSMIAGWRGSPLAGTPSFAALRIDPVVLAFGPEAGRLAPHTVAPIPPVMGWEQEFIRGVNLSPAGADEAIGWTLYGNIRAGRVEDKRRDIRTMLYLADQLAGGGGHLTYLAPTIAVAVTGETPEVEELGAIPFLSLRAARRAIAADPDHPDGYFALSIALANRNLEMSDEERVLARVTALRQFLERLPPPERYKRGAYLETATHAANQLAMLYLGRDPSTSRVLGAGMALNIPALSVLREFSSALVQSGKGLQTVPLTKLTPNHRVIGGLGPFLLPLDTAREALLKAEKYLPIDYESEEERKPRSDELQNLLRMIDAQHREANNSYEREREKVRNRGLQMKLRDQVHAALQNNLVEEALRLLTDRDTDLQKEFGREALRYAMVRVALQFLTGRLESAADDLSVLPANFDEAEATSPRDFAEYVRQLRNTLRMQIYQKLFLEGNYAEAGALLEQRQVQIVEGGGPIKAPEQMLRFSWPTGLSTSGFDVLIGMGNWYQNRLQARELLRMNVANRQAGEGEFFFRRGLLSLIEGDITGARKRFEQSTIPAIKEWDLPEWRKPSAERFLRLIELAQKRSR